MARITFITEIFTRKPLEPRDKTRIFFKWITRSNITWCAENTVCRSSISSTELMQEGLMTRKRIAKYSWKLTWYKIFVISNSNIYNFSRVIVITVTDINIIKTIVVIVTITTTTNTTSTTTTSITAAAASASTVTTILLIVFKPSILLLPGLTFLGIKGWKAKLTIHLQVLWVIYLREAVATTLLTSYVMVIKHRAFHDISITYYYYFYYEGWNFNSGNYLFTTDTK